MFFYISCDSWEPPSATERYRYRRTFPINRKELLFFYVNQRTLCLIPKSTKSLIKVHICSFLIKTFEIYLVTQGVILFKLLPWCRVGVLNSHLRNLKKCNFYAYFSVR
jgi:hypothetical protein